MEALLSVAKTAAAGVSLGGAIHLLRRSAPMQRSRIRRTLRIQAEALRAHAAARAADWQHFPREAEVSWLHAALTSRSVGPIMLTGPQGAGTSAIAERALATTAPPMLLHINLRERAATTSSGEDRSAFGTSGPLFSPLSCNNPGNLATHENIKILNKNGVPEKCEENKSWMGQKTLDAKTRQKEGF